MTARQSYCTGEVLRCDLCSRSYRDAQVGDVVYDAVLTTHGGIWGMVCHACFLRCRCTTGPGRGQKYVRQFDGRWLKTEG